MRYEVDKVALAVTIFVAILFVSNFGYGLIHETAHALIVEVLGGKLYGIYVNPLGLDAYTEHSQLGGPGFIILEMAGLCATTLVALILTAMGKEVIPAFFALRTAIYALNYTPGTDISNVYLVMGDITFAISVTILAINGFALAVALRHRTANLKDLFSSLSRGRSARNSGE
jgi:hypothetical protein